jgi:hypothetical protein
LTNCDNVKFFGMRYAMPPSGVKSHI